jgi:hypothetical protein
MALCHGKPADRRKTGNDLSEIGSHDNRRQEAHADGQMEPMPHPSGTSTGVGMTLRPGTTLRRGKGQPEGSAVTGKTGKPGAAGTDLVSAKTAGHNNSNLTQGQPRLKPEDGNYS